jgi:hypothetical protein
MYCRSETHNAHMEYKVVNFDHGKPMQHIAGLYIKLEVDMAAFRCTFPFKGRRECVGSQTTHLIDHKRLTTEQYMCTLDC